MLKQRFIISISLVLLAVDQLFKYFFNAHLERVGIFGYYLNQDFSWSLPVGNQAVIVLTFFLLFGLLYFRAKLFGPRLAWYLIASGAISNLIDRLMRGGVVDYVFLPDGGVVNLADMFIIAGVIWILCSRK